jgi:hypothetical protein
MREVSLSTADTVRRVNYFDRSCNTRSNGACREMLTKFLLGAHSAGATIALMFLR